jgi:HNH endonuclease.
MKSRKHLTRKQKLAILKRQDMKCGVCRRIITLEANRLRDWFKILGKYPDKSVPSRARFHHKQPKAEGGSDEPSNIIALCGLCHSLAHNRYLKYKKVVAS